MDAFTAAVDVLHRDPNLSVAGTYTPAGGVPVAVRLILTRHDPDMEFGLGTVQSPGLKAMLRAADVPTRPEANVAVVAIGSGPHAGTYLVASVHEDTTSTAWDLHLVPQ